MKTASILCLSMNLKRLPTDLCLIIAHAFDAKVLEPDLVQILKDKYPVKFKFSAVAAIEKVGSRMKNLKKGQRVMPFATDLGPRSTHAIYNEDQLLPISASTFAVNSSPWQMPEKT
uniref:Uncharacterized protein n=1 Tax=Glossina brevipalpis TaxID=37001 RepID=A0A1A9X4A4_9MUSC